jgi:hypothetical protein
MMLSRIFRRSRFFAFSTTKFPMELAWPLTRQAYSGPAEVKFISVVFYHGLGTGGK